MKGGHSVGFTFNDMKKPIVTILTPYTPGSYRVVYPGMNVEGTCNNTKCYAYNKRVWIQKGFGDFDIGYVS
jgi:hypothetical protein